MAAAAEEVILMTNPRTTSRPRTKSRGWARPEHSTTHPSPRPRPNCDRGAVSSDAALPSSPVGDVGLDLGLWREESTWQWLQGYGVEPVLLCSHRVTESCRGGTGRLNGQRRDVWRGRYTVMRITRLTRGSQQSARAARGGESHGHAGPAGQWPRH
jgi:hypothetical protein